MFHLSVQAFARIENHYFVNKGFFPSDSFLLDNVEKIRRINTTIVQVNLTFLSFVDNKIDMISVIFLTSTLCLHIFLYSCDPSIACLSSRALKGSFIELKKSASDIVLTVLVAYKPLCNSILTAFSKLLF